ncbi:hypothetical protein ABH945_003755 [Paraburkholderia sp. GAS333]|uniref:hypothetical protein n=1 Tax=Paraburkholderia sp. GAS333 TaxID=3156279 RepID=UPI003D1F7316
MRQMAMRDAVELLAKGWPQDYPAGAVKRQFCCERSNFSQERSRPRPDNAATDLHALLGFEAPLPRSIRIANAEALPGRLTKLTEHPTLPQESY